MERHPLLVQRRGTVHLVRVVLVRGRVGRRRLAPPSEAVDAALAAALTAANAAVRLFLDDDDNGGDELLVTTRPSPPDACGRIGVFDADPPNDEDRSSSVSLLTWTELPSPSCPAFASPPAGPSRDVRAFTLPSSTSLSSMTSVSLAFSVDAVISVASEAVFASLSSSPLLPEPRYRLPATTRPPPSRSSARFPRYSRPQTRSVRYLRTTIPGWARFPHDGAPVGAPSQGG